MSVTWAWENLHYVCYLWIMLHQAIKSIVSFLYSSIFFKIKFSKLEIHSTRNLTDTSLNVQKWTRVILNRRWVILVARKKKEENNRVHFGANSPVDKCWVLACIGWNNSDFLNSWENFLMSRVSTVSRPPVKILFSSSKELDSAIFFSIKSDCSPSKIEKIQPSCIYKPKKFIRNVRVGKICTWLFDKCWKLVDTKL